MLSIIFEFTFLKKRQLKIGTHFNLYLDIQTYAQISRTKGNEKLTEDTNFFLCEKSDSVSLHMLTELGMSYKWAINYIFISYKGRKD